MEKKLEILIVGDSFAADWTVKYPDQKGWPNLLSEDLNYKVTNIAQAGISQYKIWKQLESININNFDIIIISHTSPYRIHTKKHPVHCNDVLHKNADLIIFDTFYHKRKIKNIFNFSLKCAAQWFKYHYDENYQKDIYQLVKDKIDNIIKNKKTIKISNFDDDNVESDLNYFKYLKSNPGIMNHFDEKINYKIYKEIKEKIDA